MNFRSCCHKCQVQIFHYRNKENKTLQKFYNRHYECMREKPSNIETLEDQIQECLWMNVYDFEKPDMYELQQIDIENIAEFGVYNNK